MLSVHEALSERFYRWEKRGRGWQVFDHPISLEPPFVPFTFPLPSQPTIDDGRKPTFLSSFVRRVTQQLSPESPPVIEEVEQEPEAETLIRESLVELQTSLPAKLDISKEAFEHFLSNLSLCREPIAFELIGVSGCVTAQFVAHTDDAPQVRRQLQAHFAEATFLTPACTLEQTWDTCSGEEMLAVEFGLAREFMLPLASGKLDPFIGIIGALSELQTHELGLFQVIFQPTHHPWAENIVSSVTDGDGNPFFVNHPELTKAAEHKVTRPLFAAVVRITVKSDSFDRTVQIASDLAGSLRVFAHPHGNELIPLENSEYPFGDHIEDVLRRQSRRSGMLLNSDELIGFVHLPTSAVRSPVLQRETTKTKAAPGIVRQATGVLLGNNVYAGQSVPVRLTPEQRTRHCHIIGASGTGKSTLLFNLIREDIQNGEGIAVLDPHGDLVDKVLGIIPTERIDDVVLVDPSDEEFSIGFNILSAHSDVEKNLLASDLVSVFERLSTSWGDQMGSVLQNAILAFLESSQGGTIADVRRFLLEPAFRNDFLKTVRDTEVVYYWQKGFPQLSGNKSIGPILTRLGTFLSPKPIRYMVSQPENRLDFGEIMDSGKILLAKLPEGLLGKENSYLLGTLLVGKFQQLAMARQTQRAEARRDFWIYADEFQNYITPSMAEILSGARKYRMGLTLAHHELHQLQHSPEVASAVMSHPYTRIVFRVGDEDARKLAEGFSSFEAKDLKNLETGQAVCRVERSDYDFNLTVPLPDEPDVAETAKRRQEVITASREKYATSRTDIEAKLRQAHEVESPTPMPQPKPESTVAEEKPLSAKLPPSVPPLSDILKTAPAPAALIHEPPREPGQGRGGPEHQAIQKRIKEEAEKLGFRSTIEKPVMEGQASIDVWLERNGLMLACEVSFTNTEDNESSKIIKCLKAGIPQFAMICADEKKLHNIAAAISGTLDAELASRVGYFQPGPFIEHLKTLPVDLPKKSEKIRRGYKVTHSHSSGSTEEQKAKEAAAIRAIAESMQKQKNP